MQYLGQHFLKNLSAIHKIIAALDIQSIDKAQGKHSDTIIEIGPGKGALTFPLLENLKIADCELRIIAIEKDKKLAEDLRLKIESLKLKNVEIIEGDALRVLPLIIRNSQFGIHNLNYKIVGNIPYYITGKLLRTISELKNKPALTVLMIQKEVAERITANPPKMNPVRSRSPQDDRSHSPKARTASNGMNLLAAATQYWAKPEIILELKPKDFDPAPEVDSAVIKLTTKVVIPANEPGSRKRKLDSRLRGNDSMGEKYYKLIHIIFKQPRKTLINNLKSGLNTPKDAIESTIKSLNLPLNCRPQDLTIEQIIKLTNLFCHSALDAESIN